MIRHRFDRPDRTGFPIIGKSARIFSNHWKLFLFCLAISLRLNADAAEFFVWADSPFPAPPYHAWTNAAHTIQEAIDVASTGDVVRVTNGVYDTGGRIYGGNLTNRVAITNAVTVRSVNGPAFTTIIGNGPRGSNAVRCVYIGPFGVLDGFTLTNGHTWASGTSATAAGGGIYGANSSAGVSNCVIAGCSAYYSGGGAFGGSLTLCTLIGNKVATYGGGAAYATLYDCAVLGNEAGADGGGTYYGYSYQCTIAGNRAVWGGGSYGGTLYNTICYYNESEILDHPNTRDSYCYFCCIEPRPETTYDEGGNFTNAPILAGALNPHVTAFSPCRGAGLTNYARTAVDLDGEPRTDSGSVDVGCDQYWPAAMTGALSASVWCEATVAVVNVDLQFKGEATGRAQSIDWDWGDGSSASDLLWPTHAFATTGEYDVIFSVSNLDGCAAATTRISIVEGFTNYVSLVGAHVSPFANWTDAATNIQAAVDANPVAGGMVLVAEGVYNTGWSNHLGVPTRVVVDKLLTVTATNPLPQATVIEGKGPMGTGAVRGVFLGNKAVLSGFEIANGATPSTNGYAHLIRCGGGAWCRQGAVISNCVLRNNSASYMGGAAYRGALYNCTFMMNSASNYAGAVYGASIHDSLILSNRTAGYGGGTAYGTVTRCVFSGNRADAYGGASAYGTLIGCQVTGNTANAGGGMYNGTARDGSIDSNIATNGGGGGAYQTTVDRCLVRFNRSAGGHGGGLYAGVCLNSYVYGNEAGGNGGGIYEAPASNCTVVGNTADTGGGFYESGSDPYYLVNCIVYYNEAISGDANFYGGIFSNSCTTPSPAGDCNLTAEPGLAGIRNPHLLAAAVCWNAGDAATAAGLSDVDGEDRVADARVDIGCDEFHAANITGLVTAAIIASYTNATVNKTLDFAADIQGRINTFVWSWGDGLSESNGIHATHSFPSGGVYAVALSAFNNDGIAIVTQTVTILEGYTNYVSLAGSHTMPFTNWTTAATNIQAAIDANTVAGGVVLVGDGVYNSGFTNDRYGMRARVVVDKNVRVVALSANPELTTIQGATAMRCLYLGNGAILSGFTLSNGTTRTTGDTTTARSGGGAYCEDGTILSNCIIRNNTANYNAAGVQGGTLIACSLFSNLAGNSGGGAGESVLIRCSVYGNSATGSAGGGLYLSQAVECLVSNNAARSLGGGMYGGSASNCWIVDNRLNHSDGDGGGAFQGRLTSCALVGNEALDEGGGAKGSELIDCTIAGNRAANGGGVCDVEAYNCIVYYNEASQEDPNFRGSTYLTMESCCSEPLAEGAGNFTNAPALVALRNPRLSSASPCRDAGAAALSDGSFDLGGDPRTHGSSVDIGCFEYDAARLTGVVVAAFALSASNVAVGFPVDFESLVEGRAGDYTWKGETLLSNSPLPRFHFSTAGEYDVVLTAWNNETMAQSTARVTVVAGFTNYVSLAGSHIPPFTNWTMAATNIQDAIDANEVAGGFVAIGAGVYSNGFYAIDGVTSRIGIAKHLTVTGTNRDLTVIVGAGTTVGVRAVRCAYVGNGATLACVTLSNGFTRAAGDTIAAQSGGGAWCETGGIVSNCFITGCMAAYYGGGAYGGRVVNSLVTDNRAVGSSGRGGGVYEGIALDSEFFSNQAAYAGGAIYGGFAAGCLIVSNSSSRGGGTAYASASNCSIAANSAGQGGGAYNGNLVACTISNNSAASGGGAYGSILSNCVITFNRARTGSGGGAGDCNLYNCSLTYNRAVEYGGGAYVGSVAKDQLKDCLIAFNSVTNGSGGGIAAETFDIIATNCLIVGNTASYGGGGAAYAQLSFCTIVSNWANRYGGGAYDSAGDNNIVAFNQAGAGGGAFGSGYIWYNTTFWNNTATDRNGGVSAGTYYNCIVYSNNAPTNANWFNATMYNCCTVPDTGIATITNDPVVRPEVGGHILVPASNSPCIDAGRYVAYDRDRIGIPRPLDGNHDGFSQFDIGAYEYVHGEADSDQDLLRDTNEIYDIGTDPRDNDTDGDTMYDGWEYGYTLNPLNAADGLPDSDDDGFINRDEFGADTNPTNRNDFFRIAGSAFVPTSAVRFISSSNRQYTLQTGTNLIRGDWIDLPDQTDIPGTGGWQSLADTNAAFPRFNRLKVSAP